MTDRFDAEELLRAAASGDIPETGEALVRDDDGWVFKQVSEAVTEGGTPLTFEDIAGFLGINQIKLGAVKQFEADLDIAFTQMVGQIANGQVPASAVTQYCDEILKCAPFNMMLARSIGSIADNRIRASAVLQYVGEILKTPIFSMMLSRSIGDISDDRIPASAVVQWCDEILKCEPFNFILKRATSRRPWSSSDRLAANGALA